MATETEFILSSSASSASTTREETSPRAVMARRVMAFFV